MPRFQRSPLRIADVSAEAILLAGGARAILLQLANPGVGHGVADHSDFKNRPLDRLHGTLTYLYVIVYGSREETTEVARRVGAAHAPVRSESYDARDVTLQVWVAATLYDTAMHVHELIYGPLNDADAETLLSDYSVVATALGVPRAAWPADRAAFRAYWQRCEHELRVDAASMRVAKELLHPTSVPWWARLAMPAIRTLTTGMLSPALREAYDLPFHEGRYNRLVRVTRAVYPRLPRVIRHAPKRHYLKVFRAGLAANPSS